MGWVCYWLLGADLADEYGVLFILDAGMGVGVSVDVIGDEWSGEL